MCEHERLRTVGDRVFCCKHGAILEVEGGTKCLLCGAFIPAVNEQKQPENQPADEGKGKSTGKKRTAKKAV